MLHWEDFGASTPAGSWTATPSSLHVQRRHAGHRRGRAGRGVLRGAGGRVADARPAGGDPRRRHRRAGHRGHDARPDGRARGSPPTRRPVGSGPLGSRGLLVDDDPQPARLPAPYARPGRRGRRLVGRRPTADRPGRRRPPGPAHDADRHLDPDAAPSPSRSCGTWPRTATGRSSCRCRTPPRSARRCRPTCSPGPTVGRLVATGSPFAPVEHDGVTYEIAQANNALVFPGLGLGVTVARASGSPTA